MPDETIPHRRLRLHLDLQADSLDDLWHELRQIADDLDREGREVRDVASGGYSSGYHLTLTCDQYQTGDQYREQLEAWSAARKESRRG